MQENTNAVERYYNKKKKRRKKRVFIFYTLLLVFAVTVITVLSLTVFFNISDIAVTGNSHYSSEELIAVSGLEKGDNLFRLNKFKLIKKMKEQLPYVKEITVDRHLPVGIELVITETVPYMYIATEGGYYLLDETLRVLDVVADEPTDLPAVTGIVPTSLDIGAPMTAENDYEQYLYTLSTSLKDKLGDGVVTALDVSALYDMGFEYEGRVRVKLGTLENIDLKLSLVEYVLLENHSNEFAEVDVSDGKRAYYHSVPSLEKEPDAEAETDPETESGSEDEKNS